MTLLAVTECHHTNEITQRKSDPVMLWDNVVANTFGVQMF
jgi:hypothetical protein